MRITTLDKYINVKKKTQRKYKISETEKFITISETENLIRTEPTAT